MFAQFPTLSIVGFVVGVVLETLLFQADEFPNTLPIIFGLAGYVVWWRAYLVQGVWNAVVHTFTTFWVMFFAIAWWLEPPSSAPSAPDERVGVAAIVLALVLAGAAWFRDQDLRR